MSMVKRLDELWTEIAQGLRLMGVLEPEIRTYRFLLSHGAASPSIVARETRQSRGRVYQVLRALVQKGLSRSFPTRPTQYAPVPLADIVAPMAAQATRRAAFLRHALDTDLVESWKAPPVSVAGAQPHDVSVVSGRRANLGEARRAAVRSATFLTLAGNGQFCRRLAASHALVGELRLARTRGVRVNVLLADAAGSRRSWDYLASELGADAVHQRPPSLGPAFMVVSTERVGLLSLVKPDNAEIVDGTDLGVRIQSEAAGDLLHQLVGGPTQPVAARRHRETLEPGPEPALPRRSDLELA